LQHDCFKQGPHQLVWGRPFLLQAVDVGLRENPTLARNFMQLDAVVALQARDYHLLLDEHTDQIFAMTDDIAERPRKIGATTLISMGDLAKYQRLKDNDEELSRRPRC
jgi:hypothetical protein